MANKKKETTKLRKGQRSAKVAAGLAKNDTKAKAKATANATTPRRCACGCGEATKSYWKMGHDGRFDGWAKKIEKGKMSRNDLNPVALRVMEIYLDGTGPITKVDAAKRYETECKKAAKKALSTVVDKQLVEGESKLQNAA